MIRMRTLSALRLPVLLIGLVAGSAVLFTAMPDSVQAAKGRNANKNGSSSKKEPPPKTAVPKKGILKKTPLPKSTFSSKAVRKEHVRKTIAREKRKARAEAAAKRKAKRANRSTLTKLAGLFGTKPKRRVRKQTNKGTGVTFSNVVMVKTIPNANRGRKVPKRG